MLDGTLRPRLAGPLDVLADRLDRVGVSATAVTLAGLVLGAAACVAAGFALWWAALALWLANRFADGLDGPLARRRGASDFGGFLDIVVDFAVYGGFVLGVAVAVPGARVACAALLVAYYVSGAAFLAWSSLSERRARERPDERSLQFVGGLAEGTETVVAYVAFCVFPAEATWIAWVFAGIVAVTAGQRIVYARRTLTHRDSPPARVLPGTATRARPAREP